MLYLIGKKSRAKRIISAEAGIPCLTFRDNVLRDRKGKEINLGSADAIVSYGASSEDKARLRVKKATIINSKGGLDKYSAVKKAGENGILIPQSKKSLSLLDKKGDWIEKRNFSSCGYGIRVASGKGKIDGKYYQEIIEKKYELRVHSFSWLPSEEWKVDKRTGDPNKIAWNFHQGGHFSSVKNHSVGVFLQAKEIASAVLNVLDMDFGAVDFIVDPGMKIYFIEVNSSPGFTDFNKATYVDAFSKLKNTLV